MAPRICNVVWEQTGQRSEDVEASYKSDIMQPQTQDHSSVLFLWHEILQEPTKCSTWKCWRRVGRRGKKCVAGSEISQESYVCLGYFIFEGDHCQMTLNRWLRERNRATDGPRQEKCLHLGFFSHPVTALFAFMHRIHYIKSFLLDHQEPPNET